VREVHRKLRARAPMLLLLKPCVILPLWRLRKKEMIRELGGLRMVSIPLASLILVDYKCRKRVKQSNPEIAMPSIWLGISFSLPLAWSWSSGRAGGLGIIVLSMFLLQAFARSLLRLTKSPRVQQKMNTWNMEN
jgi:hypothetical protein